MWSCCRLGLKFCTGDFYNDYDASDFNQDYIGGQESQVKQSEINDAFLSLHRLTTAWTTGWTMEAGRRASWDLTSHTPDSRAALTKSSTTKTTLTTCSIRTCFEYLSICLFLPIFLLVKSDFKHWNKLFAPHRLQTIYTDSTAAMLCYIARISSHLGNEENEMKIEMLNIFLTLPKSFFQKFSPTRTIF